jgi:hypothetical protein
MRATLSVRQPRRRDPERGMSLVVVTLILMVLLALGMAVVWYTSVQISAARNLNARQAAANAAQAGLQHARAILAAAAPSGWTSCLTAKGNSLDSIPDVANPNRLGAILYDACSNATPLRGFPFTAASGDAGLQSLGTYTVWVRNDPADLLKNAGTNDTNGALVVRVVGNDAAGTAQVVIEAAITQDTGVGTNPNAYVYGKNIDASNSSSARNVAVRFQ